MSIENVKKLELGMDMSCNCEKYSQKKDLTREEMQPFIDKGMKIEKEAMQSGDMDVLKRAFDYFLEEENDDALLNGGCETLMSEIFQYFSWEEIIEVLQQKFSALLEHNIMRAVQFVGYCFNDGYFIDARKIFNSFHSPKSKEFLEEFEDWYGEKYQKEILMLREDIKEWTD